MRRPPERAGVAEVADNDRSARGRVLAIAAIVAALAVGAAIAIVAVRGDGGEKVQSVPPPPPPPEGILVPGGGPTVGGQDAKVTFGRDGEMFTTTLTRDDRMLTLTSAQGTLLGRDDEPVRCGDPARLREHGTMREATQGSGPQRHLVTLGQDGLATSITAMDPPLYENNPRAMGGLAAEEQITTVMVSPAQAEELATRKPDDPLVLHRWTHTFANGTTVRGELRGTLSRELAYIAEFTGNGPKMGVSTNILGITCNGQSSLSRTTDDRLDQLVLLTGGTHLRVDGVDVEGEVADPNLQGSWAMASVAKGAGKVKVEVVSPQGRVLDHWNLEWWPDD